MMPICTNSLQHSTADPIRGSMAGKSFKSKLRPHVDTILKMRQAGDTWQAIVEELQKIGVTTDRGSLCGFVKRYLQRPYAIGMNPVGIEHSPTLVIPLASSTDPQDKAPRKETNEELKARIKRERAAKDEANKPWDIPPV